MSATVVVVLIVSVLALWVQPSIQWSGHTCPYTAVHYVSRRTHCTARCWWWKCCGYASVTEPVYTRRYKCCPGWTHNGNNICNKPICYPPCANGGTCTYPGTCRCMSGFGGTRCTGLDCNNERPCYPGDCQGNGGNVVCNCMQDFDGHFCVHLKDTQTPEVTQIRAQFSYWEDEGQAKREIFGFIADGTDKTEDEDVIVWTNRQQLNNLSVTASAMFKGRDLPYPPPSYISEAKTGIARAYFKLSGPTSVSEDEDIQCSDPVGPEIPKERIQCSFTKYYTSNLTDEDRLSLTFRVSSGGFRRLVGTRTHATEHYTGEDAVSTVAFKVDTGEPVFNSPNDAFQIHPEFTNHPITMAWGGWTDARSGMDKYTWEAFKLEPTGNGSLTEVDKLRPVVHRQVDHTDPIVYPLPYAPTRPGMYSFILEAMDKANNSVYMRRFALYDKESEVTTDPNHALFISSAVQDKGFQWMTDASKPLVINWQNHFLNYVHDSGKFLNTILPFKVKVVENQEIYKEVPYENDDHDGRRTTAAIPNVRGIVRFEWTRAVNKTGGRTLHTPPNWNDVSGLNTTMQSSFFGNVTSGSTVTVWIRARDILDNTKVDSTSVTYDFTPPLINGMTFQKNERSNVHFSSGLMVTARDAESGIDHIELKVFNNEDLLNTKNVTIRSVSPHACTDREHDCYCPNALNVCYKRISKVYISNCWLMVAKNALKTAEVRLHVRVVNRAGLKSANYEEQVVTNLLELNGTTSYLAPSNVRTKRLTATSVRVQWDHAPTCHERTVITITYHTESGPRHVVTVFKDDTSYDLTGLEQNKAYKVMVTAGYGTEQSTANVASFATAEDTTSAALSAGVVAGIIVVLLIILAVLGVGFFLWRTGRMSTLIKGRQKRYAEREDHVAGTVTNNLGPHKDRACFENKTYSPEEDIYLYGGMTFTTKQPWYISKDQLTLMEEIQTGRFARIFKAAYKTGRKSREVAAKALKDSPNEENNLLMMAKINFAATKVGEHRNVLKFIGAVVDNDALGPVLVLEYCENGPMDKWLTSRRDKVNLEILEQIQTFALDVVRGMEYLVGKGIVHRKLAARNCLLTFTNEVKVGGFGPYRMEDASADEDSKGDRIPVKWTAPECLQSLKGANEKSDIWSFGITMWEIFSMGKMPYTDIRSRDLPADLRNGYRLAKPEYAEDIHYSMMQSCWEQKPEARTTFADALGKLEASFGLRPTSGVLYYYSK
ncbi:uncharacterized protein [Haliotis cracherodii]|uniref:uncharacterized protein n=1 Tax=Haliotis cracherodii TaxID=6455 RepID=UPI0039EB995D